MTPPGKASESASSEIRVEGSCTECGAHFEAGVWDATVRCEYCGSTLISARHIEHEVFVLADARAQGVIDVLIRREFESIQADLIAAARDPDTGFSFASAGMVEPVARARAEALRSQLELVESVEFLAPYEIEERTAFQGVLGRRRDIKESFVQSFRAESVRRLYDADRYNLRDRGLKLGGFRLKRAGDAHAELGGERVVPGHLSAAHAEFAHGHFLEVTAEETPEASKRDRSAIRLRPGTQIIARISRSCLARRIRVYKHLTYASVRRGGSLHHFLIDRQIGTLAGTLAADEAERFRAIPARPIAEVLPPPEVHAIASECPNCGWALDLPATERISFCPHCATGVAIGEKGLESVRYRIGRAALDGGEISYLPFWSFPFSARAGDREFTRIWDWLEALAPQTTARRYAITDPDPSRFLLPARSVFGTPELDDVFAQVTGYANWCQHEFLRDRPTPDPRIELIGAELRAEEAADLAPFALVALHDNQSTRRLNARRFHELVRDLELELRDPELCLVPFRFLEGSWRDAYGKRGATTRGFRREALRATRDAPRLTKQFNLA